METSPDEQQTYGPLPFSSEIYGTASGAPSWSDWNSKSGGQGYWLIGAASILVVVGTVMATSKP